MPAPDQSAFVLSFNLRIGPFPVKIARYARIVRHRSSLHNRIRAARSRKDLCSLLKKMNKLTLREQLDLRIVLRFRDLKA